MKCPNLEGENIAPKTAAEARLLIGKRVEYLRDCDFDKSGRGYIFPRIGTIKAVRGKNIAMNFADNFDIYLSNLREMRELPPEECGE